MDAGPFAWVAVAVSVEWTGPRLAVALIAAAVVERDVTAGRVDPRAAKINDAVRRTEVEGRTHEPDKSQIPAENVAAEEGLRRRLEGGPKVRERAGDGPIVWTAVARCG